MKAITKLLSTLALVSAAAGAMATPITFDTVLVNLEVTQSSPQQFVINITDDTIPYVPTTPITSATLHLFLSDPTVAGVRDTNEEYFVYFGDSLTAALSGHNISKDGAAFDIVLDAAAIADLKFDGLLTVKLSSALQGGNDTVANYFANTAFLTIDNGTGSGGSSNGNVPEPASLGLFGITLAGLAAVRRRKQK
jgi:hypothetical protein